MTFRLKVYDFLTTPAHVYLWCVARVLGFNYVYGPVHEDEELPVEGES